MQKKKWFTTLLAVLLLGVCCACTAQESVQGEASSALPESQPQQEEAQKVFESSLSFVNPHSGPGAASSDGYYDYHTLPDGSVILMYTDYATKTRVPLCSSPSCVHQDETCSAWYAYTGGGMLPLVVGERLVLAVNGSNDSIAQENATEPYIEAMALDGTGKEKVISLPDGMMFESPFVTDDTSFYAICSQTQIDEGGQTVLSQRQLIKFDLEQKNYTVLYTFENAGAYLEGCTADSLLVRTVDSASGEEKDAVMQYSLSSQSVKEIVSWQTPCIGRVFSDQFYLFDPASCELSALDCTNGTKTVLGTLGSPKAPFTAVQFKDKIDDRLIYEAITVGETTSVTQYFAFDLTNKTSVELTLKTQDTMHETPLIVLAEFGDNLLVSPAASVETVNISASDGTTLPMPSLSYQYTLMTKADYWNNQPNYALVDTAQ